MESPSGASADEQMKLSLTSLLDGIAAKLAQSSARMDGTKGSIP